MNRRPILFVDVASPTGRRVWASALLVIALCALPACESGTASAYVTVDTVGGLQRVTTSGSGAWGTSDAWRVGKVVRIGGLAGDDAYVFGELRGVAVDAERIALADGQSNEIRVFDRSGAFQLAFGRDGEGPGEFRYVDGLAFAPDGTLLARDPMLFRVTRFDAAGNPMASFRLQRPFIQLSDGTGFHVDADGTIYDRISVAFAATSDTTAVVRYAPDGGTVDTLTLGVVETQRIEVREGERLTAMITLPFSARGASAVSPNGRLAWGSGAAWSFTVFSPDGTPLRRVRREVALEPVTAQDRSGVQQHLETVASELVDGGVVGSYTLPDTKPAYRYIIADATGHWWVRAADDAPDQPESRTWHVFDPDGAYLGSIDLPEPTRVVQIGPDFVAGVTQDEFDVDYAVVYELIKRD